MNTGRHQHPRRPGRFEYHGEEEASQGSCRQLRVSRDGPPTPAPGPPKNRHRPAARIAGGRYRNPADVTEYRRDYRPDSARFTTIDPIKDGYDWYAYVDHDPVNRVDLWGLDSVYATFNRAEETLSVLYLVNDDHGMLVGVERYEFDASNNVVDSYISYDSDDDGNNDYYFQPQPFPAGTWNLGVHGTGTSPDGQIHHYITTDAQDTWTTYEMIPNMRGTGNELVATGEVTTWWELWIHGGGGTDNQQFSPVGNNNFQDVTYGCLRMPNDDVPSLQRMVRAALSSPNGNAKLTVTKRD